MDLKAILAANKSKAGKITSGKSMHKTDGIDRQDRPYSIHTEQKAEKFFSKTESSVNHTTVNNPPSPAVEALPTNPFPESLIGNQLVINKEPISNQLVTRTNNQLVTNKEPISNQLPKPKVTEKSNKEPISNPISNHNKEPIGNQLVTQLVTNEPDVDRLTGLQEKILFYIVEDCIYRGQLTSGFITNEAFRQITNTNANTVKTAVQRLINKKFMQRSSDKKGKRGKGGVSSFTITEKVRDGVLKKKRNHTIGNQLVTQLVTGISNQLVTNKEPNKEPSAPSSSSFKDLKETTTTDELPEEWNFDIAPYNKFGFTLSQIKQLVSLSTISAAQVEQSLIEFNYDLENNSLPPIKTNKINFLMGLLRGGCSYVSEGFKNEQEAMIAEMAKRAEGKRKNLLEEKFTAWEDNLGEKEKQEISNQLPIQLMVLEKTYGINNQEVRNWYFNYFLRNVKG